MEKDNLRDTIEEVCTKVLKDMNMTEEQMWEASLRLSEWLLSEHSKEVLEQVKNEARKEVPGDLVKAYHQVFLAGYNCGMSDEQRRRY